MPRADDLEVIHDDADLIVVNKPAGLITSSTPRERRPTVIASVRSAFRNDRRTEIGLIHRLDRDASGLLVLSKNRRAFDELKRQFADHSAHRQYLAIVLGSVELDEGRIVTNLVERADGTVRIAQPPEGKKAITRYRVLERGPDRTVLQVELETGRKHQVRVHLAAALGTPIAGDVLYNATRPAPRLGLVATELAFRHPRLRERVTFTIEVPMDVVALFDDR